MLHSRNAVRTVFPKPPRSGYYTIVRTYTVILSLVLQHLGTLFTNALAQAADDFGTVDQHAKKDGVEQGGAAQREGGTDMDTATPSGNPLAGVVIFVSQKLARKQGTCGSGD